MNSYYVGVGQDWGITGRKKIGDAGYETINFDRCWGPNKFDPEFGRS